ncbi:MAG: hypothetical protein V1791_10380, partial [Pseudomonadota bacterium]
MRPIRSLEDFRTYEYILEHVEFVPRFEAFSQQEAGLDGFGYLVPLRGQQAGFLLAGQGTALRSECFHCGDFLCHRVEVIQRLVRRKDVRADLVTVALHELANPLQVRPRFFALHPVHVLSGVP